MADLRWTAHRDDGGVRLDKYLAAPERLGSRAKAADALARRRVFLNGREATLADAGARLAAGDVVRAWLDRPGSGRVAYSLGDARDLPILFEDDAILVLDKPAGVLAVPLERRGDARSVFDDVKTYLRRRRGGRPLVVHRIDRDTSGLVVFAKHARAQAALKAQFKRRSPERVYLAVVYGHPTPAQGTWRDRLVWDTRSLVQKETHPRDRAGKDAVSRYRVVERLNGASLVEVHLVTGRRNQIRIQARLRGHTLVGEQRYIYGPESLRPIDFPRQALHAARLAFVHPTSGQPMTFDAPVPHDMEQLIERLRPRIPQ